MLFSAASWSEGMRRARVAFTFLLQNWAMISTGVLLSLSLPGQFQYVDYYLTYILGHLFSKIMAYPNSNPKNYSHSFSLIIQ